MKRNPHKTVQQSVVRAIYRRLCIMGCLFVGGATVYYVDTTNAVFSYIGLIVMVLSFVQFFLTHVYAYKHQHRISRFGSITRISANDKVMSHAYLFFISSFGFGLILILFTLFKRFLF